MDCLTYLILIKCAVQIGKFPQSRKKALPFPLAHGILVSAAQEQLTAIRQYASRFGLDTLPEPLKDAALLRITNPAASLADLARLSDPPVTKSCLSHRLRKIAEIVKESS